MKIRELLLAILSVLMFTERIININWMLYLLLLVIAVAVFGYFELKTDEDFSDPETMDLPDEKD